MAPSRLARPISPRMKWFLLLAGSAAPVAFLFFDPIVFRVGPPLGPPITAFLGHYRAFGTIATVLAAALLAHATFSRRARPIQAGMLYAASGVAALLGIVLLPIDLMGLAFAGLGLLGLWPFIAAFAYLRRAAASPVALRSRAAAAGLLAFVLVPAAVQIATNLTAHWSIANIESPSGRRALSAIALLWDPEELVRAYQDSTDGGQQARLSLAYRHLTGTSMESRLASMD